MITEDAEDAREMLLSLTDEFVYEEQRIFPEDMFFISRLLDEFYEAQSERGYASVRVPEVAWTFAKNIADVVDENEEFDWLNAYFVIDGIYSSYQSNFLEHPSADDRSPNRRHFETFDNTVLTSFDAESLEEFEELFAEIQNILELYVDLETPKQDEEGMDKSRELSMIFNSLGKRYAHEFPDDLLESSVSFEFVDILMAVRDSDRYSERDIYYGIRLVREWCELRAKREHEMLCVGVE